MIIFTMIRSNDVRGNAAEIQTIMNLFDQLIFKAPMQRRKRAIAVEVNISSSLCSGHELGPLRSLSAQCLNVVVLLLQYLSMLISNVYLLKNLLREFSVVGSPKANNAPDWQFAHYDLGDYQVVLRKLLLHLSNVSRALSF